MRSSRRMRSVRKTRGGKRMNRTRRGGKRSVRTRRGGKRSVRTRRGGKKQRIIKGGASTSDPALNASKLLSTTSQPTSIPTSDIDITNPTRWNVNNNASKADYNFDQKQKLVGKNRNLNPVNNKEYQAGLNRFPPIQII